MFSRAGRPVDVATVRPYLHGERPGVAFYTVVALGTSFDVGTFGGGNSPLVPFTFLLVSGSFVWATAGFALAVSVALLSRR